MNRKGSGYAKTSFILFLLVFTYFLFTNVTLVLAKNSGAIWTTRDDCGDEKQNVNHYDIGEHVYIHGANFDPGDYYWTIRGQPGGASCDPRQIVADGTYTVDESGSFCFDAYTVQPGDCGEYKVKFGNKGDNYRVTPEVFDCGDYTSEEDCESNECDWCPLCQYSERPTKVNQWLEAKCVDAGTDCGWYCEIGYCDANCDSDTDCSCPTDGCKGNDYYDYPDYGNCVDCETSCYCEIGTDPDEPCEPTVTLNDSRCIPTPTHTECQDGECVVVEGEGDDECVADEDCYHYECDYDLDDCVKVNASPDEPDECTDFGDCIHTECCDGNCITVEEPGDNECSVDEDCFHYECNYTLEQCVKVNAWPDVPDNCTTWLDCVTPTHTECQDGECVVEEGEGDDECSIDSDCYHYECNYTLRKCAKVNAWPDVSDECTTWLDCICNARLEETNSNDCGNYRGVNIDSGGPGNQITLPSTNPTTTTSTTTTTVTEEESTTTTLPEETTTTLPVKTVGNPEIECEEEWCYWDIEDILQLLRRILRFLSLKI